MSQRPPPIIILAVSAVLLAFCNGDYECVCSYSVEIPVLDRDTAFSKPIGYLYEFDCKERLKLPAPKDWVTIAYEHHIGYVNGDGQSASLQIQMCSGDPPHEDIIYTSKAAPKPSTAAAATSSSTPTTSTLPSTAATTIPGVTSVNYSAITSRMSLDSSTSSQASSKSTYTTSKSTETDNTTLAITKTLKNILTTAEIPTFDVKFTQDRGFTKSSIVSTVNPQSTFKMTTGLAPISVGNSTDLNTSMSNVTLTRVDISNGVTKQYIDTQFSSNAKFTETSSRQPTTSIVDTSNIEKTFKTDRLEQTTSYTNVSPRAGSSVDTTIDSVYSYMTKNTTVRSLPHSASSSTDVTKAALILQTEETTMSNLVTTRKAVGTDTTIIQNVSNRTSETPTAQGQFVSNLTTRVSTMNPFSSNQTTGTSTKFAQALTTQISGGNTTINIFSPNQTIGANYTVGPVVTKQISGWHTTGNQALSNNESTYQQSSLTNQQASTSNILSTIITNQVGGTNSSLSQNAASRTSASVTQSQPTASYTNGAYNSSYTAYQTEGPKTTHQPQSANDTTISSSIYEKLSTVQSSVVSTRTNPLTVITEIGYLSTSSHRTGSSTRSTLKPTTVPGPLSGRPDLCPYHMLATTFYNTTTGYLYVRQLGQYCYEFRPLQADWITARNDCLKRNGDLAVIEDASVQNLLSEMLKDIGFQQQAWIGLHDIGKTGSFRWTNGDTLTPSDFNAWAQMNTDAVYGKVQECVKMDGVSGQWQLAVCKGYLLDQQLHPWICQYKRS